MKIEELNQRRRAAVRLRQQGHVLSYIKDLTGLSAPTIIAACRAFRRGGWEEVDSRGLGRPEGSGRLLRPLQEGHIVDTLVQTAPQAHGLAGLLWQPGSLAEYLHKQLGRVPSPRTVTRYLKRWSWPDTRPGKGAGAAAPDSALVERVRAQGGDIYWVSQAEIRGHALMVARNARGVPFWLGAPLTDPLAPWQGFAEALQRTTNAKKVWLIATAGAQAGPVADTHCIEWVVPPGVERASAPVDGTTQAFQGVQPPARPRLLRAPDRLTHLDRLEAESIHIMREVVAETENPVMLYSIGKDSSVMLHLALKAFFPGKLPFPLLHVDTRWKFQDMYRFRDQRVKEVGARLITHINPEGIEQGINPFEHGSAIHTDVMKTQGLKQALDKYGFDAAFGGARRDEEKSRAKERVFSIRSAGHRWDPKNQRPELWRLYNARMLPGESLRVFPLSNWTELDIWLYIHRENIPIVPLYFAAPRPVVERDGMLFMVDDDRMPLREGERPAMRMIRFRTLGCYPLTAAIESQASTLPQIIEEMVAATTSERQGRVIDFDGAGSMEKKKQEGYF